jgi:hypothetical protein
VKSRCVSGLLASPFASGLFLAGTPPAPLRVRGREASPHVYPFSSMYGRPTYGRPTSFTTCGRAHSGASPLVLLRTQRCHCDPSTRQIRKQSVPKRGLRWIFYPTCSSPGPSVLVVPRKPTGSKTHPGNEAQSSPMHDSAAASRHALFPHQESFDFSCLRCI